MQQRTCAQRAATQMGNGRISRKSKFIQIAACTERGTRTTQLNFCDGLIDTRNLQCFAQGIAHCG